MKFSRHNGRSGTYRPTRSSKADGHKPPFEVKGYPPIWLHWWWKTARLADGRTSLKGHTMRRAGLLIAGCLLASGAGLALAAPASASVGSGGDHPHCHHGHGYYDSDYSYWHRHRHHYHGGLSLNIGIGIGLGIGH